MHVEMNEAQFYRLQIQTTREEAPAVLTALDNEPGLATRARSSMEGLCHCACLGGQANMPAACWIERPM